VLRDLSDTESQLSVQTSRVTELEAENESMKAVVDQYKTKIMVLNVKNRILTRTNLGLETEKEDSETRVSQLEHDMEKGNTEYQAGKKAMEKLAKCRRQWADIWS
jgi:predicted RNase H-like nuclease (RuvC/YqgF family)